MNSKADLLSSGKPGLRAFLCTIFFLAAVTLSGAIAGCGGSSGGNQTTNRTSPPTNLAYPQATITATIGQAIATDTPTVTGTVTSYSVNPALPAGLSLNTATGAITGTPTAVAAQATYTIAATNSSGSTTATIQITVSAAATPPTNLVYPQATITAIIGQAIATDTPTVTGTVTSYSVNPALPAGLSLSAATGAITGTPTAVAAQATYTVTATNSAGSTTATIQITASEPTLTYPEASIVVSVGQTIAPNIPIFGGGAATYTPSPALPAGLYLDAAGAIQGDPTTASPAAVYTITATNPASGAFANATVSITVNKALPILLDVGHANQISTLRVSATRVLSQDTANHWALWDSTTTPATEIISGDQAIPTPIQGQTTPTSWPVDMAGQYFVIGQANGLDIRSASTGQLDLEIDSSQIDSSQGNTWWKLSTDGTYLCIGSKLGLFAFSTEGTSQESPIFGQSGDYSTANVYAAPGQVLVALGPAGANLIQTISLANGTSSTGPAFTGTFNSWFTDGQHFFTDTGTTVYTYSSASVQQYSVSLPTLENLTGQGNWYWTYSTTASPGVLTIYPIDSNAAAATFNLDANTTLVPSATTIGVLPQGTASASVIDLSGATPVKTDYPLPIAYESAYAATSTAQWIVGNSHGVVLDGTTAAATPSYFGTGQVWSIAGGANYAAVATASGQIFVYSPSTATTATTPTAPVGTPISFSSSKLALSSDSTILAAMADTADNQYETDRTLNLYSLPSGSLTYSIPLQYVAGTSGTDLFDFSLSGSGTVLGQVLGVYSSSTSQWTYTRQVAPNTASATAILLDHPLDPNESIKLSPDGTLSAVSSGSYATTSTTVIYNNSSGTAVATVPGFAVGWVDNNQLLVNNYAAPVPPGTTPVYTGASIYSATGALSSTPTLPNLFAIQPVTSSSIYAPSLNQLLPLPSGTPIYSSTTPLTGAAAVAGNYIVFATGSRVVVDTY